MLESPLIHKVKERKSKGFAVGMEGRMNEKQGDGTGEPVSKPVIEESLVLKRSKRKGESEAVVCASKKNRNLADEKTSSGTGFGELNDMGPDQNSSSGKDVKQSRRSCNSVDRVEKAGHLDGRSEASLMSTPPLPMETVGPLCFPEAEPSSLKDWLQVAGHGQ